MLQLHSLVSVSQFFIRWRAQSTSNTFDSPICWICLMHQTFSSLLYRNQLSPLLSSFLFVGLQQAVYQKAGNIFFRKSVKSVVTVRVVYLAHVGLLAYRPNLCICNPNSESIHCVSHCSVTWNQSRDPLFPLLSARRGGDSPRRRHPSLPYPASRRRSARRSSATRRRSGRSSSASRRRSGRSPSSSRRQSGRHSPASRRWLGRCPSAPGRRVHSPSVLLPWGPLRLLLLSVAFRLGLPVWM